MKTHLAIVVLAILLFIGLVENKVVFVVAALVAAFIPDADNSFSGIGRKAIFRPLQWFVKHRGFLHSFTFLIIVTFAFVWFFPVFAFGFFVGYSLHLFADSFTIEGIQPFYPFKKKVSGKLRVGSIVETSIFVFFILADIFLLAVRFVKL